LLQKRYIIILIVYLREIQAVALEEIMSSIEKLNETAKVLQNMADKL